MSKKRSTADNVLARHREPASNGISIFNHARMLESRKTCGHAKMLRPEARKYSYDCSCAARLGPSSAKMFPNSPKSGSTTSGPISNQTWPGMGHTLTKFRLDSTKFGPMLTKGRPLIARFGPKSANFDAIWFRNMEATELSIQGRLERGESELRKIDEEHDPADVLTKPVSRDIHGRRIQNLGCHVVQSVCAP